MILTSLYDLHENLVLNGKLNKQGWTTERVQWAVNINLDGVLQSIDLLEVSEVTSNNKISTRLPEIRVPSRVKRSVNVAANFLCDTTAYILGIGEQEGSQRDLDCFNTSKSLHLSILDSASSPMATALKAFYSAWDPSIARLHPAIADKLDALLKKGNLIFQVDGKFIVDDKGVCLAWDKFRDNDDGSETGQCLVTGEILPIARLHPSIKSVYGAQSSGASLVSFNAEAYESFGKEQGENAPVSQKVADAYGAALNYLVKNQSQIIGDSTIVYWSKSAKDEQAKFLNYMFFSNGNSSKSTDELRQDLFKLAKGQKVKWEEAEIDPGDEFYVLSLAPNAARLSVRFFLRNTLGTFAKHLAEHYDRLQIDKPKYVSNDNISFWALLNETVNQSSRVKMPRPQLAGAFVSAVLQNHRYPETLYNEVQMRIRAEGGNINWRRAAIIKAFLMRNSSSDEQKEVIKTMKLNNETVYTPYTLGRVFAVLEMVQKSANPGITTTIKDRYFNSACATPASIFPIIINLAQKHLRKMNRGNAVYYEKILSGLLDSIKSSMPKHLSLYDQGVFQLGYYHQIQTFYAGKKDKSESDSNTVVVKLVEAGNETD